MIKAAAPITGGKSCPLDDAATSTPPAICGLKPVLFISGIVNVPVVTALATELPEIDPIIPDETTAAFAGPPLNEPTSDIAKSMNIRPAPVTSRKAPNRIKINTYCAETVIGVPKIPSLDKYINSAISFQENPKRLIASAKIALAPKKSGRYLSPSHALSIKISSNMTSGLPTTRLVASSTNKRAINDIIVSNVLGLPTLPTNSAKITTI